jgi:septum formation topological specificity factor MinE
MGLFRFPQSEEDHRRNRQEPPADHHRAGTQPPRRPDYLPLLQRELLEVIKKYVNIDVDAVKVDLVKDGNQDAGHFRGAARRPGQTLSPPRPPRRAGPDPHDRYDNRRGHHPRGLTSPSPRAVEARRVGLRLHHVPTGARFPAATRRGRGGIIASNVRARRHAVHRCCTRPAT